MYVCSIETKVIESSKEIELNFLILIEKTPRDIQSGGDLSQICMAQK